MVDDLLCQPITAIRNIETRATAGRVIVAKRLQEHIVTNVSMASTLDLWTDSIKKVDYISVTTHYINEDFALFDQTLLVKHVRNESHTAVMIWDEFKEALDISVSKIWCLIDSLLWRIVDRTSSPKMAIQASLTC